jgi:hypothetical protein
MTPVPEPAPVLATAGPLLAIEVSEPFPAAEVSGPSPAAEAAEISSAPSTVTVEEVMELATCQYIDFPGAGVIDLEAPQLLEKVLEVVTERMFAEPSIMETITSVSKALHECERAGGFAPPPCQRRRRWFQRSPLLAWSQLRLHPRRRRLVRGWKHPFPTSRSCRTHGRCLCNGRDNGCCRRGWVVAVPLGRHWCR